VRDPCRHADGSREPGSEAGRGDAPAHRDAPDWRRVGTSPIFKALGGLDLIGKAAVLKTAGRKPIGVRIPGPPLQATARVFAESAKIRAELLSGMLVTALVTASCVSAALVVGLSNRLRHAPWVGWFAQSVRVEGTQADRVGHLRTSPDRSGRCNFGS
jgi:hypothetical protein